MTGQHRGEDRDEQQQGQDGYRRVGIEGRQMTRAGVKHGIERVEEEDGSMGTQAAGGRRDRLPPD